MFPLFRYLRFFIPIFRYPLPLLHPPLPYEVGKKTDHEEKCLCRSVGLSMCVTYLAADVPVTS